MSGPGLNTSLRTRSSPCRHVRGTTGPHVMSRAHHLSGSRARPRERETSRCALPGGGGRARRRRGRLPVPWTKLARTRSGLPAALPRRGGAVALGGPRALCGDASGRAECCRPARPVRGEESCGILETRPVGGFRLGRSRRTRAAVARRLQSTMREVSSQRGAPVPARWRRRWRARARWLLRGAHSSGGPSPRFGGPPGLDRCCPGPPLLVLPPSCTWGWTSSERSLTSGGGRSLAAAAAVSRCALRHRGGPPCLSGPLACRRASPSAAVPAKGHNAATPPPCRHRDGVAACASCADGAASGATPVVHAFFSPPCLAATLALRGRLRALRGSSGARRLGLSTRRPRGRRPPMHTTGRAAR